MLDKTTAPVDPYARARPRTPLLRMFEDITLALTLLTRLPAPRLRFATGTDISKALWAYPLVGALVGTIGAVTYELAATVVGLPGFPPIVLALAVMTAASGALHEDGLADFADGIGGGQSRRQKLEIMRDSQIGTFGATALILLVAMLLALLYELSHVPSTQGFGGIGAILIFVASLQRAAMGVPMRLIRPARRDGLAATAPRPAYATLFLAVAIAAGLGVLLVGPGAAMKAAAAAVAVALAVTWLARRYLGGHTGDVLGAVACLSGIAALAALLAELH